MSVHTLIDDDTLGAIGALRSRLEEILRESRELRARLTRAAEQAWSWPDTSRATYPYVDLQRTSGPGCATTRICSPERN